MLSRVDFYEGYNSQNRSSGLHEPIPGFLVRVDMNWGHGKTNVGRKKFLNLDRRLAQAKVDIIGNEVMNRNEQALFFLQYRI